MANAVVVATDRPPDYQPDAQLVSEAHGQRQRLIRLGQQADEIRRQQIEVLHWFWQKPERCWALGYESVYAFVKDPEIQVALWGNPINSTSTMDRYLRMIDAQLQVPEIDLFEIVPKSVTSTGLMPSIEARIAALPAPETQTRREAVADLREYLERVGTTSWRDNHKAAGSERAAVLSYDAGTVYFHPESGRKKPILRLLPQAGPYAAEILHRLLHPVLKSVTMDADNLTAWVEGKPVTLAQILTRDRQLLSLIADAVHAERQ